MQLDADRAVMVEQFERSSKESGCLRVCAPFEAGAASKHTLNVENLCIISPCSLASTAENPRSVRIHPVNVSFGVSCTILLGPSGSVVTIRTRVAIGAL